ncbi:hypothetical protein AN641_04710 [Candidatus Epulonipiscioides gigas]|nr:hypothetical protein AN641_04710 [Epulopiscium sp. SCG-C07WGA-EpuloA2]
MLKLVAIITMFIDHFAVAFLNPMSLEYSILRLIGRISMPLFAYMLANGYIHTRNYNKYLSRLLIMAIVAQIPFTMLLYKIDLSTLLIPQYLPLIVTRLNIGFTFCVSLIFLKLMDIKNTKTSNMIITFIVGVFLLNYVKNCDYGAYCIFIVFVFYLCIGAYKNSPKALAIASMLILALSFIFYGVSNQIFSALAILPIIFVPNTRYKYDKWIFYTFYPAHLFILAVLS